MASRALCVDDAGDAVVRSDIPEHHPEDGEMLIEVLYSGVNPADLKTLKVVDVGPSALGMDYCGRVLKAPVGCDYQVGDVVAGYTLTGAPRPLRFGTHQKYIATAASAGTFKVPKNMPEPDAAAFMSVFQTAGDALFNRLGLPLPDYSAQPQALSTTLVIWGGSTSLGVCAIQLARAIGITSIIVTASSARHQLLIGLGATRCFDYKDPDVVAQVKEAVIEAGNADVRAFETVGLPGPYRALLDTFTGPLGNTRMAFSWIHTDERPQDELVLGGRHYDVVLKVRGGDTIVNKARPLEGETIWKAVEWAVANYGTRFRLPSVQVFEGTAEGALAKLEEVAALGLFGKVVIKQPMQ
ncbi:hypothetical protein ACHAQA_004812 [Verticillium albo-atrum]